MGILDKAKKYLTNKGDLRNAPGIEFEDSKKNDDAFAQYVYECARDSFEAIKEFTGVWQENRRAYEGETFDHYDGDSAQYSEGDANSAVYSSGRVADKIEDLAAIQVANTPTVYPLPKVIADQQIFAPLLQELPGVTPAAYTRKILEFCFKDLQERRSMQSENVKISIDARLTGAAAVKIYLDDDYDTGQKDIYMCPIPLEDLGIDPSVTDYKRARYMFHRTFISVYDAVTRFPDKAEDIVAAALRDVEINTTKNTVPGADMYYRGGSEKSNVTYKDVVCVIEGYFRDKTTKRTKTAEAEIDPDTGEELSPAMYEEMPKYPNGRRIFFLMPSSEKNGKCLILKDEPNPYNTFPFELFVPHPISWSVYGRAEATVIRSMQIMDDNVIQQTYANLKRCGNNYMAYDPQDIDDIDDLDNEIAKKIPMKRPGNVQFFKANNIINDGANMHGLFDADSDRTSGVYAPSEGAPKSQSGRAIGMLQESTNRKVRPSQKIYAEFLQRVWKQAADIMIVAYKTGRTLRVSDDDGVPIELPFDLSAVVASCDVTIGTESEFPADPINKFNMLLSLAQTPGADGVPLIDTQTLLETLKFPGVADVLARRQALVTAQTMQAQQGMMAPQPNATPTSGQSPFEAGMGGLNDMGGQKMGGMAPQ